MIKDLYQFEEVKKNVESTPLSFYFALDNSGSMDIEVPDTGKTRFEILIQQTKIVVANLNHIKASKNAPLDIGFCTFDSILIKRDFQPSDITEIEDWLDGLIPDYGGTPFDIPIANARDYYVDVVNPNHKQVMFFVTDGEPSPISSAQTAYDDNTDMIESTGVFATNPVDMYGVNIDLADTTYIEVVTNQPPSVVNASEPNAFFDLVYGIISETVDTTIDTTTLTSADSDEIYNEDTYVSTVMGRNNAELKSEISKSNLQISFSIDNEFAKKWLAELDSILNLTLFEKDLETNETSIMWKGRLVGVSVNGNQIVLKFESIFSSLRRFGLNRIYQRACSYSLFGFGCGLYQGDFETETTVIVVSSDGLTLTTSTSPVDDYLTYGFIKNESGTSRFIAKQEGNEITLSKASEEFSNDFVTSGPFEAKVYPGCIKSRSVCETKFNNVLNFGGFPFMPVKNPFQITSII